MTAKVPDELYDLADVLRDYTVKSAAARYARLLDDFGSVKGIDYRKMAEHARGEGGTRITQVRAAQDVWLDNIAERSELAEVFEAAAARLKRRDFVIWYLVRVEQETKSEAARRCDVSLPTVDQALKRADLEVQNALIERDLLRTYCGRDLLPLLTRDNTLPTGIQVHIDYEALQAYMAYEGAAE